MAKHEEVTYIDREQLDAELMSTINDIRSAEAEAKHIVEQAEASVKGVQLDGAARERALREQTSKAIEAAKENALSSALEKAKSERSARLEKAEAERKNLMTAKRGQIDICIDELYSSLTGVAPSAKPARTRSKKAKE